MGAGSIRRRQAVLARTLAQLEGWADDELRMTLGAFASAIFWAAGWASVLQHESLDLELLSRDGYPRRKARTATVLRRSRINTFSRSAGVFALVRCTSW